MSRIAAIAAAAIEQGTPTVVWSVDEGDAESGPQARCARWIRWGRLAVVRVPAVWRQDETVAVMWEATRHDEWGYPLNSGYREVAVGAALVARLTARLDERQADLDRDRAVAAHEAAVAAQAAEERRRETTYTDRGCAGCGNALTVAECDGEPDGEGVRCRMCIRAYRRERAAWPHDTDLLA